MTLFRLKELARDRGWTAEEVAQRSGVKLSTVQRIWQNKTPAPSYSTMRALARAFGVPIENLEISETQTQGNFAPALLVAA